MKETPELLLTNQLDELAAFEPAGYPFISLYLNLQPDQHGRDNFESFVRKEFSAQAKSFAPDSPELKSFKRDTARINDYLRDEVKPSANGLAIFASAGADDYFKAVQLNAPLKRHQLHVGETPHLYPLARVIDQYPRYVAVLADTKSARLFVFGLGNILGRQEVQQNKLSRPQVGEWTQMRYQRHMDNFHLRHAKEVVEALDRVVREESVKHIILAGDEVIIPLLREQLPERLQEKVIDVLRLDIRTPEHDVLNATMDALHEHNLQTDAEKVRQLFDEYRAGGLAVVAWKDTVEAIEQGQVDELLLSASAREIKTDDEQIDDAVPVDFLVTRARQTGARVTFIEETALLSSVGGVGAMLRYRV